MGGGRERNNANRWVNTGDRPVWIWEDRFVVGLSARRWDISDLNEPVSEFFAEGHVWWEWA